MRRVLGLVVLMAGFPAAAWAAFTWSPQTLPIANDLYDLTSVDQDHTWACGGEGYIIFYDGSRWEVQHNDWVARFNHTIRAFSDDNVWMLGEDLYSTYFDGQDWQVAPSNTSNIALTLYAIDGPGFGDLWAVGPAGTVGHWDGQEWQRIHFPTLDWLEGVAVQGFNDVTAIARNGSLYHYDGAAWTKTLDGDANWSITRVQPFPGGQLWAVGYSPRYRGLVLHYDGSRWVDVTPGDANVFLNLHGKDEEDMWMCGEKGLIRHYDHGAWTDESLPTEKDLMGIAVLTSDRILVTGQDAVCFEGIRESVPTATPVPTDTFAPAPTPTPTELPAAPSILAGGFMATDLLQSGGALWMAAVFSGQGQALSLDYQGLPTGLSLFDDGSHGDDAAGDGFAQWREDLPGPLPPATLLLEMSAGGGASWPYLTVTGAASAPFRNDAPFSQAQDPAILTDLLRTATFEKTGESAFLPFSFTPMANGYKRLTYAIRNAFKTPDGADPEFEVLQPGTPDPQTSYPVLIYLHGGGFDKETPTSPEGYQKNCTSFHGLAVASNHMSQWVGKHCPEFGFIGIFSRNSWGDMFLGDGSVAPDFGSRHYSRLETQAALDFVLHRTSPRADSTRVGVWGTSGGAVGLPLFVMNTPEVDRAIIDSGLGDLLDTVYSFPIVRVITMHLFGTHPQDRPELFEDAGPGHLVTAHGYRTPTFLITNRRERTTHQNVMGESIEVFQNPRYYDQNLQLGRVYDVDHDGPNLGSHPQGYLIEMVSRLCYYFLMGERYWLYEAEQSEVPQGGGLVGQVYTNDVGDTAYNTDNFSQDAGRLARPSDGPGVLYRSPVLSGLRDDTDYEVEWWLVNPSKSTAVLGTVSVRGEGGQVITTADIQGRNVGDVPSRVNLAFRKPAGDAVYLELTSAASAAFLFDAAVVVE